MRWRTVHFDEKGGENKGEKGCDEQWEEDSKTAGGVGLEMVTVTSYECDPDRLGDTHTGRDHRVGM